MAKILIINGHPDPRPERFCAGLCLAYGDGAAAAGHAVRKLAVGDLPIDFLRSSDAFLEDPPDWAAAAQDDIRWADHLVLIFPLWLGGIPALTKAFFEQTFRYGFALGKADKGYPQRLLKGRTARIVVTMGMPAIAFRLILRASGVTALQTGLFWMAGISPARSSVIGMVDALTDAQRARWLEKMKKLAAKAR